ncbi:MAG: tetratricopeptide repeat protein [Proteobacteria bacterium]|nr:tetratricopeptide repeat protein [Pseudomonadota bacterium]
MAAWLIMQVTEVLITLAHLPHWIGPTIIWLLVIGFPISLIFSWFYELTPEGISLEKDVDPEQAITYVTGRRLDFIVISMLIAAVILFAYDKWWIGGPPEKSIAVLPFTNMSDDPGQEYFSDGISEELLNLLAKIPELTVISRSSAFSFKDKSLTIPEIARRLNVAHVIEGSVRKAGNQVRITAQLIEASTDKHLWSETYDRELKNIFAVQDEISVAIVGALKEHLGLQLEVAPRVVAAANTEAHEAYLRGRFLVVQRTRTTIDGAVREFEKAISLDPDYAIAHAELATAILLQRIHGPLTGAEAIAKAAPHAEQAMALDPTLAEAHAATGFLLANQANFEEALTHYRQAIQINPNNSIVYSRMADILGENLGHYKETFAMKEMALRLNPLSILALGDYVGALIERNRLAEADRELEKLAVIAPAQYEHWRAFRTSLGGKWANQTLGDLDRLRIDPESKRFRNGLTWVFASIGLEKEVFAISDVPPPFVLTLLGKPEDAVTVAQARFAGTPTSLGARRDLGMSLAGIGNYARARPFLEEMWQSSGGRITRFGWFYVDTAAALIAIRRDAGDAAEVGELLASMRDNVRRLHEAGIIMNSTWFSPDYDEGLAAYLAGEHERGLALIAKASEDGFFIMQRAAYLQALYDDPGFAPIWASQEARQARERKRFLDIVCTDNPYAAVWQPAEGTCEKFAGEGGN